MKTKIDRMHNRSPQQVKDPKLQTAHDHDLNPMLSSNYELHLNSNSWHSFKAKLKGLADMNSPQWS